MEEREKIERIDDIAQGTSKFTSKDFYCDLSFPLHEHLLVPFTRVPKTIKFYDCIFTEECKFIFSDEIDNFIFEKCVFNGEVYAEDADIKGKVRFRECTFTNKTNFNNTKFNDLIDFWRCTFQKPVIFFKTDFNETAVFSSATFEQNVLFTYSLINKQLLLRGTIIQKGLDLSLAIIRGELGVFNLRLDKNNFKAVNIRSKIKGNIAAYDYTVAYDILYEELVRDRALIPLENKIETYRIIKKKLLDQGNNIDGLDYNVFEKQSLLSETIKKLRPRFFKEKKGIKTLSKNTIAATRWFWSFLNLIQLTFNWASNNFGDSYFRGIVFTAGVGWLLFYGSILNTNLFEYSLDFSKADFQLGLKYYFQFLIPTHKFSYIETDPDHMFYFWDFLGRIFVGYGIYQTIQAFRKYK